HGLVFIEERFRAVGPLCLPDHDREYPQDLKPVGEPTKYPATGQPGENAFDLKKPEIPKDKDKPDGPTPAKPKPKVAEDRPKYLLSNGPPARARHPRDPPMRRLVKWLIALGLLAGGLLTAGHFGQQYLKAKSVPRFTTATVSTGKVETVVNSSGPIKP